MDLRLAGVRATLRLLDLGAPPKGDWRGLRMCQS
jgi:hypothetical protein